MEVQAAQQAQGDIADPYNAQLAQDQLERAYENTQKTYADGRRAWTGCARSATRPPRT